MRHAGRRSGRAWRAALVLASLMPGASRPTFAQSPAASVCTETVADDRIEAVSPEGEIRLAALGPVRLADIRLPDGEAAARPLAWLRSLPGRRVRVTAGSPDRWQRRAAALALVEEATPINVGELLVSEGFAIVDADEQDALCNPTLLAAERRAREARLGFWKADRLILPAEKTATLAEQVGRFALAEGRVVSIGERATRTYLNFGRAGTGAFTVTLPKRTWSILRGRGVSAEGLRGRRIRARGIVEMWRAPTMEIVAADMLEILDAVPLSRR
jgi:endonuclease YncB( thermonuclease family)